VAVGPGRKGPRGLMAVPAGSGEAGSRCGRRCPGAAATEAGLGSRRRRLARGEGIGGGGDSGSGEGDSGVRAFSACGCFEMGQRREGKRSTSGFEAQVYLSVNKRIYVGRAMWALRIYSSVTDEYKR
jgi:hypothetical protein